MNTDLDNKVFPVNDRPLILNQEVEALATQDNPFSFTINGQDEEENALTYFFQDSTPGDMAFQGNFMFESYEFRYHNKRIRFTDLCNGFWGD